MNSGKLKIGSMFSQGRKSSVDEGGSQRVGEWEVRPCGMLVQKRNSDASQSNNIPQPTIKVRVKNGSLYHEVRISPHASFGELKKMLAEKTRLHPEEQKILYKNKERSSREFLDDVRVKDGSKLEVVEDIASRERRCLEKLKNVNSEKASKSLAEIISEVSKLVGNVASLEAAVTTGKTVKELDIEGLTELLMTQLIKLDGIAAAGDLKLQRRTQVKRIQKYIEILDMLKSQCGRPSKDGSKVLLQQQNHKNQRPQTSVRKTKTELGRSESTVVTTKWELFD